MNAKSGEKMFGTSLKNVASVEYGFWLQARRGWARSIRSRWSEGVGGPVRLAALSGGPIPWDGRQPATPLPGS